MNKKFERQVEDAIDAMIAARKIIDSKQARIELLEKVAKAAQAILDQEDTNISLSLEDDLFDALDTLKEQATPESSAPVQHTDPDK